MAISIDWENKIINVPKEDLTLVSAGPPEIRELDINDFRLELRTLEASIDGMPFDYTHNHISPISISGINLARVVELVNGYTVTFENGNYQVNLIGANSNISDVTNLNSVGLRSANSAGLVNTGESGLTPTESATLTLILNLLEADESINNSVAVKYLRGTLTELIRKNVTGSGITGTITLLDP